MDGTPQGGIISPAPANCALDGLERVLQARLTLKPLTLATPYKRAEIGRLCRHPDLSALLHVAEFRHAPMEVAPLHGIRAKAQCSLVRGQRFFIPPEPAQQIRPRGVV
jgi:hypothetical protein